MTNNSTGTKGEIMENSRFKFRVFGLCCNSKLEKNWVNITEVGNFFIDKDGKLIDESAYFDPINHPEHFIVEQCTGFSDKNGKLIYEGDIVKIPDDYETYGFMSGEKREVYFRDGGFRLKPKDANLGRGHWLEQTNDLEIIGNIHEQSEQKDK